MSRALRLAGWLLVLLLLACSRATTPVVAPVPGGEVTFLVAADTHLGVEGIRELNRRQVDAMNAIPGTPWPKELGGTVATPAAVLVAGDLTDHGRLSEWGEFLSLYGPGGRLRYPLFEGTGNHDRVIPVYHPVVAQVARRHRGLPYGFDLGELRVLCLDEYPDASSLVWLAAELKRVGPDRPVVCTFHYSILGPFSNWWSDAEKRSFREVIGGHRIVGIFHGHYHGSEHYVWEGVDVYDVGSPRWRDLSFAVARWWAGGLSVAEWNWEKSRFTWHHDKQACGRLPARPR